MNVANVLTGIFAYGAYRVFKKPEKKIVDIVYDVCKKFTGIDPILVLAIIDTESSFDIKAYRDEPQIKDGSIGLMQILYGTATWLGFKGTKQELYMPEINVYYGVKFLDWLRTQCNAKEECMIMSYNEGYGNYKKGKTVWYYYTKVKANYQKMKLLYA